MYAVSYENYDTPRQYVRASSNDHSYRWHSQPDAIDVFSRCEPRSATCVCMRASWIKAIFAGSGDHTLSRLAVVYTHDA